jgi:serine/threonine-protein kinase
VAGRYRFERVIGEGAMGTVISAHHELLDVPVAVKILSLDLAGKQSFVDRFLREARAVARLKSEHVARVMDVGTLPTGQPFIVMELLEGADLERRLVRDGKMPVGEAADFVLQALDAIAHAHAAGIVHRDLKPANLFITLGPDGREMVKVLDFGIAKLVDARSVDREGKRTGALTGEHAALGSPSYMSPEQVRDSGSIDHRADLWAVGTILYELVTGVPAFDGHSVGEIFGAILHSRPSPLSRHVPDPPPMFEEVIARCLERDPERRWADAAQLARAIAPFGTGAWSEAVARVEHTLARSSKPVEGESVRPPPASFGSGERVAPPDDPALVARRDALARRLLGGKSSGSRTSPVRASSAPSAPSDPAPARSSSAPARAPTPSVPPAASTVARSTPPPAVVTQHARRAPSTPPPVEPERVRLAGAETLIEGPSPTPVEPPRVARPARRFVYAAAVVVALAGLAGGYALVRARSSAPPSAGPGAPVLGPAPAVAADPVLAPAPTAPTVPTVSVAPSAPAPSDVAGNIPPTSPEVPASTVARPRPAPKPGASPAHKPGLPGVLDSPN